MSTRRRAAIEPGTFLVAGALSLVLVAAGLLTAVVVRHRTTIEPESGTVAPVRPEPQPPPVVVTPTPEPAQPPPPSLAPAPKKPAAPRFTEAERKALYLADWVEVCLAAERDADRRFGCDSRKPDWRPPSGYAEFHRAREQSRKADFLAKHRLTLDEYYAIQAEALEKRWISEVQPFYKD